MNQFLEECKNHIDEYYNEINNIKLYAIENKWGVTFGTIVKDKYGRRYVVSGIDVSETVEDLINNPPLLWGKPIRANGDISIVELSLNNEWELE